MKNLRLVRHLFIFLIGLTSCLLLGCGGCASQEKKTTQANAIQIYNNKATKWKLNDNAMAIYTYLLYDQALRQNDSATLLYALEELSNFNPPVWVYIDAGIFFMNTDPTPLLPLLHKGLESYPDDVSLNLLNAELLQKAGQSKEAIKRIREFGTRHPQNTDAKLELALLLVNSGQHDEAEHLLNNITGVDRTSLVEYYHAKALIGMKKTKEALPHLEKAIMEMPSFTEALVDLAYIYEQDNNFYKAREVYEDILEQQGYNPEVLLRFVYSSLRLKEPEKALQYFDKNAMLPPNLSATIGSMLVEEKYYDLAEPILLDLVNIPDAPQELFFYLAAISYERDKDAAQTYKWLSNITEDHEDYLRALLLRLQLLLDLNRYDEALELVKHNKKNAPEQKELLVAEVRILAVLEQYSKALDNSRKIIKKWPEDTDIAYLHASILDETGDKKGALNVMEDIVKSNPNHYQALNYIGYTLAEENRDLKKALSMLRKATALSPQSDYILDSLAWVLYKLKQLDEAWIVINQAVELNSTNDPVVWEHYADIAKALGKNKEARIGYTKALEYSPSNAKSITKRLNAL